MNQVTRSRLDAILDTGLSLASMEDRAWLDAQRAADPGFDAEVQQLADVHAHVQAWGAHVAAQVAPSGGVDSALAGIFDGLDAGLYDDGLDLAAAPAFDDADHGVVGLAASGPRAVAVPVAVPVAAVAEAAAAQPAATPQGPVVRMLRDNRWAQGLAAAAAAALVLTAGLSAVSLSSPDQSESAVADSAAAPTSVAAVPELAEPAAAPLVAAAPAESAPMDALEVARDRASRSEASAEAEAEDDVDALNEGAYGGARATGGGAPSPQGRPASASATTAMAARSSGALDDLAGAGSNPFFGADPADPEETEDDSPPQASRGAAASGVASAPAPVGRAFAPEAPTAEFADEALSPPAHRYTTWASLRPALVTCLGAGRSVTVGIARRSGVVSLLDAPAASSSELRCLRGVIGSSLISPAPTVSREVQVTRPAAAPVSGTTAR